MQMILANGATAVKDSAGNVMIKDNLASNALTCDSEGNCMLKDELTKFGKFSDNVSTADNALTCDSEGNCMLKDELMSWEQLVARGPSARWDVPLTTWSPQSRLAKDNGFSLNGSFGGVSGGIKFADNSLTCDSEGNCMLKDELRSQGNPPLDHTMSEAKKDADQRREHRRKMMDAMMAKMKDNLGGVNVGFGKAKVGVKWADNSLTCDSEGNCMLKDKLISIGGKIGKFSGSVKFNDLKDNLVCLSKSCVKEKEAKAKAKAEAEAATGAGEETSENADYDYDKCKTKKCKAYAHSGARAQDLIKTTQSTDQDIYAKADAFLKSQEA